MPFFLSSQVLLRDRDALGARNGCCGRWSVVLISGIECQGDVVDLLSTYHNPSVANIRVGVSSVEAKNISP